MPNFPLEHVSESGAELATPIALSSHRNSGYQQAKRFIKVKDEYKLEDFTIKVKLGKGAFGNVYLVELADPRLNGAPN